MIVQAGEMVPVAASCSGYLSGGHSTPVPDSPTATDCKQRCLQGAARPCAEATWSPAFPAGGEMVLLDGGRSAKIKKLKKLLLCEPSQRSR